MLNLAPIRSILFCPADKPERYEKVALSGADAIAIDLEDAVGLDKKASARLELLSYLAANGRVKGPCDFQTMVRLNNVRTRAGLEDLHALIANASTPHAWLLPKVESPFEVQLLAEHLSLIGKPTTLIAMIETAAGLAAIDAIAGAHPTLGALAFGGADYAADLACEMSYEPLLQARHTIVAAAARARLFSFDVPCVVLDDEAALSAECGRVRALGFSGKLAIHPKQISIINQAFTPNDAQIAKATRVLEAFDAANGSVCEVDGKMIDEPVVRSARQILLRVRR